MITGKNFIGSTLSSEGELTFDTYNPLLNTKNGFTFYEATDAEVNSALKLATDAFDRYQYVTGAEKARFLRQIADEIEALGDELVKVYCLETGLPEGRAKGERGRTVGQLRSFADLVEEGSWVNATIDTGEPNRSPAPKPDLRKIKVPLGPVVVFGASNFPLAYSTAGGDTASALAAGCPVVVKSHPMHAGTGELVASAILKAVEKTNMPNGVFSNLNSSGIEVGVQLVKHPNTKAVGFTGSIKGGRALFDMASNRPEPIPVFAEMGSINPVVLLPGALERKGNDWAKTYASSITLGTGQFCTNPGLLIGIEGEALDSFTEVLAKEIVAIAPSCMLHPNIHNNYITNQEAILQQDGAAVIASYSDSVQSNFAKQAVAKVTGAAFVANPQLHEEVFGPFSLIVACKNEQELLQSVKAIGGQLTGTVIATDSEISEHTGLISALRSKVGRLIFNGVPTGVEVCPSMQHGGPYPASTDSRFSAVGIHAIDRWVRPVSYQSWPNSLLPEALKNENPLGIDRLVNGTLTKDIIV